MTRLSILREKGPTTVVADIFLLDSLDAVEGREFRFEVLSENAEHLKTIVGEHQCFYIDHATGAFWARLRSLEPCVSTHPGLGLMRDKPTFLGVLAIVDEVRTKQ